MPRPSFRPRQFLFAAAPVLVIVAALRAPISAPETAVSQMPSLFPPTLTPSPIPPTPTLTPIPPTTTPIPPTPTTAPNAEQPQVQTVAQRTSVRVGLQVGHWKSNELPEELKRLRTSTGTAAGGVTELQVNLDIAQRAADLLRQRGIEVDVLPATVPPGYDADAFVAIHSDGSSSTKARGFKAATPWRTSPASQHLLEAMTAEYGAKTDLPRDGAITVNMRGYYAFSWRRHEHAVAKTTPSIILEMAFLTNPTDRNFLTRQQDLLAAGIANGVIRYLNERDPNNKDALIPPEFKTQRPISDAGVDIHSTTSDTSKVIAHASASQRLFPFQERNGWLQVFIRGSANTIGWVRRDLVVDTDDPAPTPPPSTDS